MRSIFTFSSIMGVEEAEDLGTVWKLRPFSGSARGADNSKFPTNWGEANLASWGPSFWELDSQKLHSEILGLLFALHRENNSNINYVPNLRCPRKSAGKRRGLCNSARRKDLRRVSPLRQRAQGAHAQSPAGWGAPDCQPLSMLGPTARPMGSECTNPTPPSGFRFPTWSLAEPVIDYPLLPSTSTRVPP